MKELVDAGCEAIYFWGVHADPLAAAGKIDLIAKAVEVAKEYGVPSGVGCHDLNVVTSARRTRCRPISTSRRSTITIIRAAPKPEQLKTRTPSTPATGARTRKETIEVMKTVQKPWIAFKIMAAGAIPPKDAFRYAFENGADHVLVGMFDFEIAEDVEIAKAAIAAAATCARPWRS